MSLPEIVRLRIGSGFDLHPLGSDPHRRFILGGIEVASGNGPLGHSDADVICHALADAILGSAGLGGIGDHFPSSDASLAGADSMELLRRCLDIFTGAGYALVNADATVVLQAPRLAVFRPAMEAGLGALLGVPVSVKAKSPENVGALGRQEAVVCFANVLSVAP